MAVSLNKIANIYMQFFDTETFTVYKKSKNLDYICSATETYLEAFQNIFDEAGFFGEKTFVKVLQLIF